MRYFFTFWVILSTFFIFSGTLQAADVVEKVDKQSISTPIEPIEPKANSNKANFWQKKFKLKRKQNEIEPIKSFWYILLGIYTLLSIFGFLAAGVYFIVLLAWASTGGGGGIILAVFAAMIIGTVLAILYAIKLFGASAGREGGLKGLRFILGYLVGILFTTFWLGVSISIFGLEVAALGIILPMAILIFNVIDHLRYRKYLKTLTPKIQ